MRTQRPTSTYVLAGAIALLTVLSVLALVRLTREPEAEFRPVNFRTPNIEVGSQQSAAQAARIGAPDVSGLEYLQRVRVPFAPPEPAPEPEPAPAPAPTAPATTSAAPPPQPQRKPFYKPRLRPTRARTQGASNSSSKAFLPAPPAAADEAEAKKRSSTGGGSASESPPVRQWRTPTGHSATRP